ncbi:MAG: ATP-grasp domain-containing protein [Nitrospirae bacterium]|nr:ATP-grasp domain-containing protein [Nitrospirota bacterium]
METVLILGVEDSPGLIASETFRRRGFKVIAGCHVRICTTFFSRYPHKRVLYPSPDLHEEAFIKWLCRFIKAEKVNFVLPIGGRITQLLSKHKDELASIVNLYLVDFPTYGKALDKAKTMKIAMENNIPCPRTYFPEEGPDMINKIDKYPVLIKPRFGTAAKGITLADSKAALKDRLPSVEARHGKCIVQEFIPHSGMQFKAEILMNKQQDVISWVVYNKPRYFPPEAGSSTLNCTVDRPDILAIAEKMLKVMKWYGMGDCDFIEDPRDNTPKLMEINPRITRSIKIGPVAGVDFFYNLYRLAAGEDVPQDRNYEVGKYLRYLPGDIMWFLKSRDRFKARPSFFKFYDRDLEYEISFARDPGAIIGYLLHKIILLLDENEKKLRYNRSG